MMQSKVGYNIIRTSVHTTQSLALGCPLTLLY